MGLPYLEGDVVGTKLLKEKLISKSLLSQLMKKYLTYSQYFEY